MYFSEPDFKVVPTLNHMDQNRSENGTNQQQNVHLHMHHVCNCQGSVYPTYYPAVGYRSPVPPLVSYPPPPVARPYLQHYQYTQFNMGSQYSMPITHVAATGPMYGANSSPSSDVMFGAPPRDRRDKGESQEGNSDVERNNDFSVYDYGQITPPASELLLTVSSYTSKKVPGNKKCMTLSLYILTNVYKSKLILGF